MPYDNVVDMEKSVPAMKNLTAKQKAVCLEIFNSAMKDGDDEKTAIAKAIGAASKIEGCDQDLKMSERRRMVILADRAITDSDIDGQEFEILKVGQYFDHRYGKFSITSDILSAIKKNFDENVLGIDVAVDENHDPTKGALAWIKSLSVKGESLFMTLKDVSSKGKEYIKDKVFKYFSVEYEPFVKVSEGKKMTIPNVLRGVALTNRPVLKNLSPTFLSEDVKLTNSSMSVFTKFCDSLLAKDKVSADDLAMTKTLFAEMEGEEQVEAQPKVDEVEAKAAETVEAETKAAEEAAKVAEEEAKKAEEAATAAKAEVDATAAEGGEALKAAEAKLAETESEKTRLLAEVTEAKKLAETLLAEKKARELSERTKSLILSETSKAGFSSSNETKLSEFVGTLSDDQWTSFSELMKNYVTVDTSEVGRDGDGYSFADTAKAKFGETEYPVTGMEDDMKIKALAKEKKITYNEAAVIYADSNKTNS